MQIEYTYTEALLKKAANYSTEKPIHLSLFLYLVIIIIVLCGVLTGQLSYLPDFTTTLIIVAIASFPFLIPVVFFIYLFAFRKSFSGGKAALREFLEPTVHIQLSEAGFDIQSGGISWHIPWNDFTKLWQFNNLWLLFRNKSTFYILPVEKLTENMKKLIETKLKDKNPPISRDIGAMQVEFTYADPLLKKAVLYCTLRRLPKAILMWFVFFLCLDIVVFLVFGWPITINNLIDNAAPIMVNNMTDGGAVIILLGACIVTYLGSLENAKAPVRAFIEPTLRIQLSEEGFDIQAAGISRQIPWRQCIKLRMFKDLWLVFTGKSTFYMLPVEKLTEDMKQFIETKLKENNVKIS